jgi:hypothetical protein
LPSVASKVGAGQVGHILAALSPADAEVIRGER